MPVCERGKMSIENDFVIGNTKFTHKDMGITKSKRYRSIINYFLINAEVWKLENNIKMKSSAEIATDHYLVKMKLK